jgi:ribosomal protein L29
MMTRSEMKWAATAVAGVVLLTLAVLHLSGGGGTVERPSVDRKDDLVSADRTVAHEQAPEPARGGPKAPSADPEKIPDRLPPGWKPFEAWAAGDLQAQFGSSIKSRATQASLRELRRFLKEAYPEDWEAKLDALLHKAFPEYADQVLDTFSKMDAYDAWFEANKQHLATMRSEEIREALRQRRDELFGEDAAEIWPSESGKGYAQDLLKILGAAEDIPLEDKLTLFEGAVEELPMDEARGPISDQEQAMASAFLSMESVQNDLRDLSPEERAASLRHIRESLGMDDKTIEDLEALDAEREERWQRGLRYMAERAELTAAYEGPALERELRRLRERYFDGQAGIIGAEEARGFFRYKRRRIYGRN